MPNVSEGPYVQVAAFCESVIEDRTGVISLIRIIDTLIHGESGPNPPNEMPPFLFSLKLVIMLKSGAAKGRHNLRIVPELPNGTKDKPIELTTYFEGEEKGQNIVVDVTYQFKMEGLYWFEVFIGDNNTKLSSIPLRAKYERVVIGSITPPSSPAS